MADRSEFQYGIGVGAPDVDRRTRGLKLPPPGKTVADVERESAEGQFRTRQTDKKKVAASAVLGALIGLQAGPQISEYVHNPNFNPQALVRDMTSFPGAVLNRALEFTQGWNWFKQPEVAVPDTFDPKATKGVIGVNNSVQMTPEEYAQIAPPEIEGDNANLPFFIKPPEGVKANIQYELTRDTFGGKRSIDQRPNPNNPNEMITGDSITVNNALFIRDIPSGSILLSPVDGMIYHGRRPGMSPDGSYPHGAAFFIKAIDEHGNSMDITISTVKIKPLIETPSSQDYPSGQVPRVPIAAGQPIGVIMTGSSHESFPGQIYMSVGSRVKDGDTYRGGAASINIPTIDGKAITLD